ncbi:hypothetical protein MPLB_1490034 [Mesorhizobium sp. ORS 3324]|nr:hypothetical protein MPLB_1490034 [Mesorhizobium sp. ORS 3324]
MDWRCFIEAMKMETRVTAPQAGRIRIIRTRSNDCTQRRTRRNQLSAKYKTLRNHMEPTVPGRQPWMLLPAIPAEGRAVRRPEPLQHLY